MSQITTELGPSPTGELESASETTKRILTGVELEAGRYSQKLYVKEVGGGRAKVVMSRKGKKNYVASVIVYPTLLKYTDAYDNEITREVLIVEHGNFGATSIATCSADLYAILAVVASGIAQQDPYFTLRTSEGGKIPPKRDAAFNPSDFKSDGTLNVDRIVDRELGHDRSSSRHEDDSEESTPC